MQTQFHSFSTTRTHLKQVFDAAEAKVPVELKRGPLEIVVVKKDLFTALLSRDGVVRSPELYEENDGWTIVLPGTPVGADSVDFNEAVADFLDALQEYAEDWVADENLRRAPSHCDNETLVQLVTLLSEDELRSWAVGEPADVVEGSSVEPSTLLVR